MPPQEKAVDIILLLVTLLLVTIGTVMIYSSSSILAMKKFNDGQYFLKKQIFFVLLGLGIMVLMTKIPYDRLKKFAYPGVLLSAVLLSLLLIPHIGIRAGGATRWLKVGFFSFQVTEVVKVSMVLFLAHFLTKKYSQITDFKRAVLLPLLVIVFIVGLILLEPDFGKSSSRTRSKSALRPKPRTTVSALVVCCRLTSAAIHGIVSADHAIH